VAITQEPGGLIEGLALHGEGLRLLVRERRLWALAAVPLLLSLACVGAALAALVAWAGPLHALVTGWMPVLEASGWSWIWIGPARLLLGALGVLLFLGVAGLGLVLAFVLATVLAAPFLDALSRRVEAVVQGRVTEHAAGGWGDVVREGVRAAWEEAKRTGFFLALQLAVTLVCLAVPGGAVVAPVAIALVTIWFLPLDYASYALDRRRVRFREKRRWLRDRAPLLLGYGAGAFAVFLVPGLNFLALPVLVTGGTLLALRHPPEAAPPGDRAHGRT